MHCRSYVGGCVLIGIIILGGCGAPRLSTDDLRKNAEAGDAGAQHQLALRYEHGEGVPRDMSQALRWHEKAAAQNHLNATADLGFLYMQGEGLKHDYARALALHRQAAARNWPASMHNIGVMYDAGWGVPENDAEAVRWYQRAAELGEASSQLNLGVMYIDGTGVPQDRIEGMKWLHLARTNPGNKQAQWHARDALARMGWTFLGVDESKISKAEHEEALRRANHWIGRSRRNHPNG